MHNLLEDEGVQHALIALILAAAALLQAWALRVARAHSHEHKLEEMRRRVRGESPHTEDRDLPPQGQGNP